MIATVSLKPADVSGERCYVPAAVNAYDSFRREIGERAIRTPGHSGILSTDPTPRSQNIEAEPRKDGYVYLAIVRPDSKKCNELPFLFEILLATEPVEMSGE